MSIELLIKLHAPKAVSVETDTLRTGRSPDGIGREEVLGALAHAEHLHPVGVQVLRDCIRRAGSLEGGLKYYVGAANMTHDGGYGAKVLAERARLRALLGLPTTEAAKASADAKTQAEHDANLKKYGIVIPSV